jgi:hypothetical protein
MNYKQRGQVLDSTDTVRLLIHLKDQTGHDINADTLPSIAIVQPGGEIYLTGTSNGVKQNVDQQGNIINGQYYYDFKVPFNGPYGAWNDIWSSVVQGYVLTQTFTFIVTGTQIPENPSSDGLMHLGDEFPMVYSQQEIFNINKLLSMLKERLNSDGKSVSKDAYGNTTYINCSNFSIKTLVSFLAMSLSEFNQVPYLTNFQFCDTEFIAQFAEILVQTAAMYALTAKGLIEKGSEFTISDNGITFTPAAVSEYLKGQADSIMSAHTEKIKLIKNVFRPHPIGLSGFDILSSDKSPIYKALNRRRENRIF